MARQERMIPDAEVSAFLVKMPGWSVVDGWLTRRYKTDGWPTTLMLVNAIGFAAEAADHHPDLAVSWPSVTVRLRTHSANGLTEKDLELARKIEEVALWRPPATRPEGLTGTTRPFVKGDDGR